MGFHPHLVKIQLSRIPCDREATAQKNGPKCLRKKNKCKVVSKYNVELHYHVACTTNEVPIFGYEMNFKLRTRFLL